MLTVKIKKRLPDFCLNVDFSVSEKCSILSGPSGSGKTTLLRCIAGLERVEEGYICQNGIVLLDTVRKINITPSQRGIGFAYQDNLLFPHLNVEQNLLYGEKNKKLKTVKPGSLKDLLNGLRLPYSYLHRYPQELSGGEKQRVSLARALLAGSRLYLFDEPFNSLDMTCFEFIEDFLREWIKRHEITTIIVTHEENKGRVLGEKRIYLDKGINFFDRSRLLTQPV